MFQKLEICIFTQNFGFYRRFWTVNEVFRILPKIFDFYRKFLIFTENLVFLTKFWIVTENYVFLLKIMYFYRKLWIFIVNYVFLPKILDFLAKFRLLKIQFYSKKMICFCLSKFVVYNLCIRQKDLQLFKNTFSDLRI